MGKKKVVKLNSSGIKKRFYQLRCFFCLLVCILCVAQSVASQSLVVRADKENERLTLDDYLASDTNVFERQLADLYQKMIETYSVVRPLENWENNFVEVDPRIDPYINYFHWRGPKVAISPSDANYEEYIRYCLSFITAGIRYGDEIVLVNSDAAVYEGGYLSAVSEIYTYAKELYLKAKDEYEELAMIYGGFAIIGGNAGKGFTVNITENNLFNDGTWDALDKKLYGTGRKGATVAEEQAEVGKVEKYISEPIGNGAWDLYKWMFKWDIDLTIDGLVYGRMASSYKGTADFTHFGLENYNPYGIVGATAYYVLRRIILSALPIVLLIMLIANLPKTSKKREQLKEFLEGLVLVIALLFAFPYALNFAIYIRDVALKATSVGMTNIFRGIGFEEFSVGGSIVGMLYSVYSEYPSFLMALLLAAGVGSGFVYFLTYLRNAVLLAGAFGLLPLVMIISIWDKKILKSWWNIFFPCLCCPFIDVILLQIPTIVLLVYKTVVGGTGGVVLGIVLMVIMWTTMSVREYLLKKLGFDGFGLRNGLGLIMLLSRLANGVGRHRNPQQNGNGNGNGMLPGGDMESIDEGRQLAAQQGSIMGNAMQGGLPELPMGEDMSHSPVLSSSTDKFLEQMDDYSAAQGAPTSPIDVEHTDTSMPRFDMADNNVEPVLDEDFRQGLTEDMDVARYNNLAEIDGLNNQIAQNEATMRNAGYTDRDSYLAERAGYVDQIDKLDEHIATSKARMADITDVNSEQFASEKSHHDYAVNQRGLLQERVSQLDRAANLDRANQVYRAQVDVNRDRETQFAQASGYGGMSSRTFASGRDYMYTHQVNDARRSLANFRNFDTKRFEGILSPRERENFYREREIYQRRQHVVQTTARAARVATAVAGASSAVMAASLLSYGGPGAMVGAATVAGAANRGAQNVVGRGVNAVGTRVIDRMPMNASAQTRNVPNTPSGTASGGTATGGNGSRSNNVLDELRRRAARGGRSRTDDVLNDLTRRANNGARR